MAVSALDAALQLTKVGGVGLYLLPEALTVRERALAGIAADGKAPYWVSRIAATRAVKKRVITIPHTTFDPHLFSMLVYIWT